MTQLNVQMSLTLADAASGPLRAFSEGLAALKAQTAGVSQRLEAIAVGITNVSKAAAGAQTIGALSGNLGALAAAMTGVRTASTGVAGAIGNVGRRASAAGVGTYALEQAMGALGGTLTRMVEKLTATASGLGMVGTEARAAGAGVRAGAAQMEGGLIGANTHATTLGSTLKGLAAVWAAFKIEKGLVASIDEASKFQQTEARLKALNRPEAETRAQIDSARKTSETLGFVSINEALESRLAAITGTANTSVSDIDKTINDALKAAIIFKLRGDTSDLKDIVRNLYGLAEMRGITANPEAMTQSFDFAQRVGAAAGGKLTIKDMETVSRQVKYGGGALLDEEGWSQVFAFANQLKASGHGGGGGGGGGVSQAGTAITMLLKWAQVGPKNKETVRLMSEMGLMDASKVSQDKNDTTMVNVREGAMTSSQSAIRQPLQWANKVLGPAMLKYVKDHLPQYFGSKDPNDPHAQEEALGKLAIQLTAGQGGVNVGNAIAQSVLPGPSKRLADEATLTRGAKKTPEALADLEKTYALQVIKFDAALNNLKIVIGTQMLPLITSLIEKFGEFLGVVSKFGANHPVITSFAAWGAAIAAVALAIGGFAVMFGAALRLSGLMAPLTTAFAAARVGAAGMIGAFGRMVGIPALFSLAGAAVNTFAGLVMLGLKVAGGVVAAFFLGWEIGTFLANLNIGGQQVKDWGADLIEWVVNAFRKGWNTIGAIVSSIIPGARAAAVEGMGGPRTGGASGSWDKPAPSTGGASGSWDAPTHSGSGRGSYAGYNAQADAASKGRSAKAGLFKPARAPSGDDEEAITGSRSGSGGRGGAGRFANYDAALDDAKNAYRLEEAEMKRHLKTMDEEYKAGLLSVDAFFADKLATANKTVNAEIAILEREKAAYAKQGDKAGVNRVKTDIDIKRIGLAETTDQIAAEKRQAINKLDKDAIDLQRTLLQTSGQRHAAELLHLQQEMKAKIDLLLLNGKITQGEADAMLARSKAAIDFQESYKQLAPLQEKYAEQLAALDSAERNGTLSRTAAEDRKLVLMKQEAAEIDVLIAKWREMAVAAGDDKAILELDKLGAKNKSVENQLPAADTEYLKATQTGFEGIFKAVISGSESGKTAIEKFAQSMNNTLLNLISKRLGDALFDSIFGGIGTGGKGGGGGGGLFGGLFGGGAGSGGLFGGGGGGGGLLGSLFSQYGGAAMTSLGFGSGMVGFNQLAGAGINVAGAGYSAAADSAAAWEALALLDVGTNYVPQDMIAMIHKGEAVVPAAYNVEAGGQGGDQRPINYSPTFILDQPQSKATQSQVASAAMRGAQRVLARGNA